MGIDIKRLKHDAEYWDEVAPEGATHIAWLNHGWTWWKPRESKCGMLWHKRFSEWQERYDESVSKHPRPTKPSASEWDVGPAGDGVYDDTFYVQRALDPRDFGAIPDWNGEGLPPVGCECEMQMRDGCRWESVIIQAYSVDGLMVMVIQDSEYMNHEITGPIAVKFRPICTKEQREREELEEIVEQALIDHENSGVDAMEYSSYDAVIDAILAAGFRKEQGK